MRITLMTLLAASVILASTPFMDAARGSEGTLATPELGAAAEDGSRLVSWRGTSALHITGLCMPALGGCFGSNDTEDGRFFLPAAGSAGQVVVDWRPVNDSLRELRVTVGGVSLAGASPLVFDLLGSQAGEYSIHAEPASIVAGRWDQMLAWTATFHVDGTPTTLDLAGTAAYETTTGCILLLCETTMTQTGDALVVPWRAAGALVATWDAEDGSRILSVAGTGFSVQGPPPLSLDLSGIEAGEWNVELRPAVAAAPLATGSARWSVALTPHG